MTETEWILVFLTAIFVLGIGAQWLAWRLRVPSILLLLAFGLLAGPGLGWIDPDALFGNTLFPIVSLSVAVILFEGGLSLRLHELHETLAVIRNLVTVGALVTWVLASLGAWLILGFDPQVAVVLGAILVVTGPTVIGPLLRHIHPVRRAGVISKWEGIIIDPVGASLAVLVFEATQAIGSHGLGEASVQVGRSILLTVATGGVIGAAVAGLAVLLLRRYWMPDFLQSPMLLMFVAAAFTASNLIHEDSGLLTVTLMGIVLANQKAVPIRHIVEFKENLRVLLISTLFILLASRLKRSDLAQLGWHSAVFVAFLMLIVRPASVLLSTIRSGLNWREKAFLSWLAPRGIVAAAVASVFALRFGEEGTRLVQETFLVIAATVAIYGLTTPWLARRLGLATPNPQGILIVGANSVGLAIGAKIREADYRVVFLDTNRRAVREARMAGFEAHCENILAEGVFETIDLGGVGRILLLTPNDEVNALAALHVMEVFGRASVFQIPPQSEGVKTKPEAVSGKRRGRPLFAPHSSYLYFWNRLREGAQVKKTPLSDEFGYAEFRAKYGDAALPLFIIDKDKNLSICTADREAAPQAGESLIALVDDPDPDSPTRDSDEPSSSS
ncbi:sodium:proton antiporter [Candidatus Sumerlaeota bacterium]|nr:sodium:proton antiporter [Candidatus Sumerlaeota bacterium]